MGPVSPTKKKKKKGLPLGLSDLTYTLWSRRGYYDVWYRHSNDTPTTQIDLFHMEGTHNRKPNNKCVVVGVLVDVCVGTVPPPSL